MDLRDLRTARNLYKVDFLLSKELVGSVFIETHVLPELIFDGAEFNKEFSIEGQSYEVKKYVFDSDSKVIKVLLNLLEAESHDVLERNTLSGISTFQPYSGDEYNEMFSRSGPATVGVKFPTGDKRSVTEKPCEATETLKLFNDNGYLKPVLRFNDFPCQCEKLEIAPKTSKVTLFVV